MTGAQAAMCAIAIAVLAQIVAFVGMTARNGYTLGSAGVLMGFAVVVMLLSLRDR